MDNVIPFPKRPHMIPGWDFGAATMRSDNKAGIQECQTFLDQGYEPFAITSYQEIGGKNLVSGQPTIVLVEKIWFKRPVAPVPANVEPDPPSTA